MTYSEMQQPSLLQSKLGPKPARPQPPPHVRLEPNHQWHPVMGAIPAVWDDAEIARQLDLREAEQDRQSRNRRALEQERDRQAREDAARPPPPPTVEERLAALEATVARLTAPARIPARTTPSRSRPTRSGDGGPKEAA